MLAFLIRNAWFANDDFQNLIEASQGGLTLDYLLTPTVKTRFAPGHRFVDWVVLEWPGNQWIGVVILTAVFLALATFFCAMLVREMTGSAAVALIAAALLGTWVGWVRVGSWWTAAAHLLPVTAFSIAALWTIVLWDKRDRQVRYLLAGSALAALALSFSVRGVLIPIIAAIVLLLGYPQKRSITPREIGNRLARCWPPLLSTGVISAVFAYIESQTLINKANPPVTDLAAWTDLMQKWILNGIPAMAINHRPFTELEALTLVAGLAVLIGLMVGTIRGSRSAWLWASIFALIAFFGAQVGWGRINYLGSLIALDARFREGDILAACVLIPLAWASAGRPSPETTRQRLLVGALAITAALIWATGFITGAHAILNAPQPSAQNPGVVPLRVFTKMKQTLLPALAADRNATIVNTERPKGFLLGAKINADFSTAGIISTLLPEARISFWQPTGTPILIEDDGTARRLEIASSRKAGRGWPLCFTTEPESKWLGPGASGALFELPREGIGDARLLTVRFKETKRPGQVAVTFLPKDAEGLPALTTAVGRERRGLRIPVPPNANAVSIGAWGGLATCVSGASVATVRGRARSPDRP